VRLFDIQLAKTAAGDLNSIPDDLRRRIVQDVNILSTNPFLSGSNVKKLKGFKPPLYRLRSGDCRVLYRVMSETITLMRVIDRKDLERIIKRMKL
jgi:mRNA-degrading endonuclease RelE of RelBE toxin-antitoxin system